MLLVAFGDFKDNYGPELCEVFGYGSEQSIFSISEIIVAFIVCIPIGLFMLLNSNGYLQRLYGYCWFWSLFWIYSFQFYYF